jgi:hypothetical protein
MPACEDCWSRARGRTDDPPISGIAGPTQTRTSARLVVADRLASSAGRNAHQQVAWPSWIGIDSDWIGIDLDDSSPRGASSRECCRSRCPLSSDSAGPDQDRHRLGRQLTSWCIVSRVRPAETAPPDRPGRSGQAWSPWTAARLVVHRLASAAGRDAHLAVTRPGRIGIDTNLDGSSPRAGCIVSRVQPVETAPPDRPGRQLASWCIVSRVRPVRDAHSGGKV